RRKPHEPCVGRYYAKPNGPDCQFVRRTSNGILAILSVYPTGAYTHFIFASCRVRRILNGSEHFSSFEILACLPCPCRRSPFIFVRRVIWLSSPGRCRPAPC